MNPKESTYVLNKVNSKLAPMGAGGEAEFELPARDSREFHWILRIDNVSLKYRWVKYSTHKKNRICLFVPY
jgi:hypothetical protein